MDTDIVSANIHIFFVLQRNIRFLTFLNREAHPLPIGGVRIKIRGSLILMSGLVEIWHRCFHSGGIAIPIPVSYGFSIPLYFQNSYPQLACVRCRVSPRRW